MMMIIIIIFSSLWLFYGREFSFSSPLDSPVLLFDMTFDLRLPSYLGGLRHVLSGFLGFSTVAKASQKMKDPGPLQLPAPKPLVYQNGHAPAESVRSRWFFFFFSFFSWMNARASWSKKRTRKTKISTCVMMNSPFAFIRFTSTFCFCFEIGFFKVFHKEMNGLGHWEAKAIVAFHSKILKKKKKKDHTSSGGSFGRIIRHHADANVKAPEMSAGQRHRHYYYYLF